MNCDKKYRHIGDGGRGGREEGGGVCVFWFVVGGEQRCRFDGVSLWLIKASLNLIYYFYCGDYLTAVRHMPSKKVGQAVRGCPSSHQQTSVKPSKAVRQAVKKRPSCRQKTWSSCHKLPGMPSKAARQAVKNCPSCRQKISVKPSKFVTDVGQDVKGLGGCPV